MAYHSKYSGVEVDALLDKIKDDNVGSIDSSLSTTSENPVQNKVITKELNKKVNETNIATINGQPLTNGGNIEVVTDAYDDTEIKGKLTELQTEINGKQEALTLTVKDNGNIVLANIQGQSKEFMPATPSGDPMHYAYVTAGAEYNDTGADIVKTAPWADMVDDDYTGEYGKTVVHKAGYWYLNGLGDLTTNEIRKIYTRGSVNFMEGNTLSDWKKDKNIYIRTNFNYNGGAQGSINGSRCAQGNFSLKVMLFCNQQSTSYEIAPMVGDIFAYIYCYHILGVFANHIAIKFWNAINLITLKFCPFYSVRFNESSNLSVKSVLYMINNGAKSNTITITLHKTVYDRCMANDAIKTALQNHTNVSLASA